MTDECVTEDGMITVNAERLRREMEDALKEAVEKEVRKAFDVACEATVARMVMLAPDVHRSTVKALGERVLKELREGDVPTTSADANCNTTPDGDCIAEKPCMHSRPEPLPAGEYMHYWSAGGFVPRTGFLCDTDAGFKTSSKDNVTCPDCLIALGLYAAAEDPEPKEAQASRGNNTTRCPGCYDSFSGPWCGNCDQWPCVCS